jgi:CarD family transcriptional regulator
MHNVGTYKKRNLRKIMASSADRYHPHNGPPQFAVGDLVVHPHHGAGRIISRQRRQLEGSERLYLEIELVEGSLTIMVPCESAAAVGLRAVAGPKRLARIVAVLQSQPDDVPGNWRARERHYRDKLSGGDVLQLASVIRDLGSRAADTGLAHREEQLYERTRRQLASELGCSLGLDANQALSYIDQHISCGPPPNDHSPSNE